MIETAALQARDRVTETNRQRIDLAVAVCSADSTPRLVRTLDILSLTAPRFPKITVFVPGSERSRAVAALDAVADPSALHLKLVGEEPGSPVISAAINHLETADRAGVLFVLDRGALPHSDWIGASLRALAAGADAVAANATARPAPCELAPQELGPRDLALRYGQLIRKLEEEIDPDPDDPAPRHGDNSGAGLAVTLDALRRAGGMPQVPSAPGRHLLARLRFAGGIVRHAPDARVMATSLRPSIPWLVWPEDYRDLFAMAADVTEVERALRLRAGLRTRLKRQHAALPAAEQARAVRAELALSTPFLPVPAKPVPLKRACEHLSERLGLLRRAREEPLRSPLLGLVVDPAAPEPGLLPKIGRSSL